MKTTYFITGISTDVGKTLVSALFVNALEADYWKPVQSGNLDYGDAEQVQELCPFALIHPNAWRLTQPFSPHHSAMLDGVEIQEIIRPKTHNTLVIEGAGGVLVPLNHSQMVVDLIHPKDRVILVSCNYLGSINHTAMSIEVLKARGLNVFGIVYSGTEYPEGQNWITDRYGIPTLLQLSTLSSINKESITPYVQKLKNVL